MSDNMLKVTAALRRAFDRRFWLNAGAILVLLATALIILWRPIALGEVFLPIDLVAHLSPWRFSYERTQFINSIISDLVLEYYPRRLLATEMLRHWQLPLWNPYILAGTPLLADGYSALLYPGSILFVIFPVSTAFGWYALIHLALAGMGTYWVARLLGMRMLPAIAAALTYMGCGFTMMWLAFPDFSPVIAWLPVALGCVESYERGLDRAMRPQWLGSRGAFQIRSLVWNQRYALALALILAACVLCQIQLAFYAGAGVSLYWLERRITVAPRRVPQLFIVAAGVAALALLLSAAQWIPTFELARASQRSGSVSLIGKLYLDWRALLRFIDPTIFGKPRTGATWGPPANTLMYPYIGLLPLLLALIGAWQTRSRQRLGLVLVAAGTLLLAALPPDLLTDLPLVNQLPAVDRWTMVLSLMLALLAGFGLSDLLAAPPAADPVDLGWISALARAICVVGLLVFALGVVWFVVRIGSLSKAELTILAIAHDLGAVPRLITLASFVLVSLAWRVRRRAAVQRWSYALGGVALLLIMLDMEWYGASMQSSANPHTLFRPTPKLLAAIGRPAFDAGLSGDVVYPPTQSSVFLAHEPGLYRVLGADFPCLQSNTFSIFHTQDLRGYASLFSERYLRFARRWEQNPNQGAGWASVDFTQAYKSRALLDLMNVRYIFFNPRSKNIKRYSGIKLVSQTSEGSIYLNPTALPRAFLVHQAETLPNDEAVLAQLTRPEFPVGADALLTEPLPPLPAAGAEPTPQIVRYEPTYVEIVARARAPALLTLSDTQSPGWEASIDNQATHVYTVDTILRGVVVPAGGHTIVFEYRPPSFLIGAALSGLGVIIYGAMAVWLLFIRRQARA